MQTSKTLGNSITHKFCHLPPFAASGRVLLAYLERFYTLSLIFVSTNKTTDDITMNCLHYLILFLNVKMDGSQHDEDKFSFPTQV